MLVMYSCQQAGHVGLDGIFLLWLLVRGVSFGDGESIQDLGLPECLLYTEP